MRYISVVFIVSGLFAISSCNNAGSESNTTQSSNPTEQLSGQSGVKDENSQPNIVQTAVGSKDHSTLVTAVKAASLVDALSNAGPFTVFAPTNAAFDKLPKGTVEDLLKPENKDKLSTILGYHTYVGVLDGVLLGDGMQFDMVDGGKVSISKQGDKTLVNGTPILASIRTSNGMIHVIEDVLLPK